MKSAAAVFVITFLTASAAFSQVHIRENATITPKQARSVQGAMYDAPRNPKYPRAGGTITVQLGTYPGMTPPYPPQWLYAFGEDTTGQGTFNPDSVLTLQDVKQWEKLYFYLMFPDSVKLYHGWNDWDQIIEAGDTLILYYNRCGCLDNPETNVAMKVYLSPDYSGSLDQIPPPEVLSDLGNPFVPTDVIAPFGGHAFITVDAANPTNPYDGLYMELPNRKLLLSNTPSGVGDTIDLGYVTCGEPLRFYLRSGKPIVAGTNLYPKIFSIYQFFPGDGTEVMTAQLNFDDWTDLVYDKLYCSLNIVSDTSNIFVQIVPDTLSPGDTAMVILKNYQNCSISDFDPSQSFEVGIDSGANYGTILSSDGIDTAGYFADMQQGFKFIAADSINGGSATVGIRVGMSQGGGLPSSTMPVNGKAAGQNGLALKLNGSSKSKFLVSPSIKSVTRQTTITRGNHRRISSAYDFVDNDCGIGYVTIKGDNLKILNHAPWTIWPYLPPVHVRIPNSNGRGYKTVTEVYPSDYNHKRGFIISVTDENGRPPKKPMVVEINHNYQQGTGGHVHGGSGDLIPSQSLQGIFWSHGESGEYLDLTTDANGMAFVDSLIASRISGTYLITAFLKSDPAVKDTVNLNVQVPGLVDFETWALLSWPLLPHPFTFAQTTQADHPDNDNCTVAMVDSLFWATLDFYVWSASPRGGNAPRMLSLNDMSLPWGGLFDGSNADWYPPHSWHRIGRSADINNPGRIFQYPDPEHPDLPVLTKLGKQLRYWMNHCGGTRVIEGHSVHYEFIKAQ